MTLMLEHYFANKKVIATVNKKVFNIVSLLWLIQYLFSWCFWLSSQSERSLSCLPFRDSTHFSSKLGVSLVIASDGCISGAFCSWGCHGWRSKWRVSLSRREKKSIRESESESSLRKWVNVSVKYTQMTKYTPYLKYPLFLFSHPVLLRVFTLRPGKYCLVLSINVCCYHHIPIWKVKYTHCAIIPWNVCSIINRNFNINKGVKC